jgi:small subunit ribosomal protein S19
MARSIKKGVYVDEKLMKKVKKMTEQNKKEPIKTWSRSSMITPDMIGITFEVHNGKDFTAIDIREEMVGHRLGEFVPTTKFYKHGGKMERELAKSQERGGVAPAAAPKKE